MGDRNTAESPLVYEIRIENHLEMDDCEWFEGMTITNLESGEILITGPVVDQCALHGLLMKIRQFNLTLISVKQIPTTVRNVSERG